MNGVGRCPTQAADPAEPSMIAQPNPQDGKGYKSGTVIGGGHTHEGSVCAARRELQQVQGLAATARIFPQRLTSSSPPTYELKHSVTIMTRPIWLWQTALPALSMAQTFNMWPLVDTAFMANALNVSQTCVTALWERHSGLRPDDLPHGRSDRSLLLGERQHHYAVHIGLYVRTDAAKQRKYSVDTSSGMTSATTWINDVYDNCDPTDAIYVDTKLVPIDTVAVRYTDGLGLACLTDQ
ncbi:hypothetical protein LTR78_005702 [Recurvomyces mirabilis]|uniref:Uncharacterized protein n=1 Tax=Recurvomyces mirabilis TaxID=574656 RepID=A0AAE0WM45_9PEZI|nr:hypothetical protein LTR78_005702 [Recurvomyces mirabilis]KAK5154083.1 hypothetical protein LTS14_006768 [Recurvomyces mirabilis]